MISHCGGAADFAHHHTPFFKIPFKFRIAKVFNFRLFFFGQIVEWRDVLITRFPWGLGKILQDQCHAFPAAYPNSFRPGLTVPRLRSGSSPTQEIRSERSDSGGSMNDRKSTVRSYFWSGRKPTQPLLNIEPRPFALFLVFQLEKTRQELCFCSAVRPSLLLGS